MTTRHKQKLKKESVLKFQYILDFRSKPAVTEEIQVTAERTRDESHVPLS